MISLPELECRYDGPIPRQYMPRDLAAEERALLQVIRERAAEHREVLERRKDQLRRREWAWAERSEDYAKDLRDQVHNHVRNVRLLRMHINARAAIAKAKGEDQ